MNRLCNVSRTEDMNATAEVLLVIECTRSRVSDESTPQIRKYVEDGVSWMALIQFAIVHGVLPLVANTLKATSADLLPRDVLLQFDRVLTRAEARNRRQWSALTRVMQAFSDERVRLLAFKGTALTSLFYGDLRLRESHDIDLWAAPEDTAKAGEILRSIGYLPLPQCGHSWLRRSLAKMVYRSCMPVASMPSPLKQVEFISADGDTAIDLQNIRSQLYFKPDFNGLWDRRSMAMGSALNVPTLSKADYLLTLAVHGAKHSWRRMNWIVDVDRLLTSSPDLDWDLISACAIHWRCQRRLCSTLAIRSRLYSTPLTHGDVAKYLTHWTTERVLTTLLRSNVTNPPLRTAETMIQDFLFHYHLIDRRRDRVNHAYLTLMRALSRRIRLASRTVAIGSRKIHIRYPRFLFQINIKI